MSNKLFITTVLILLLVSGCSQKEEAAFAPQETKVTQIVLDTVKPTQKNVEKVTEKATKVVESTEEILIGKVESPLTGLFIDESIAQRRPFAVTINNMSKALPQSGISQADIYYEVLAEGGITRIIAVFQNSTSEKIGPVRSARHYFLDFALDNDAVYIHHGGSPQGYASIKSLKVNDFDGMNITSFFFRDKNRMSQKGMYEHSSYIDATKFFDVWNESGYRVERKENAIPMFDFSKENMELDGETAKKVTLTYSGEQISVFEYDEENKIYNRFQNSKIHLDEETKEQLAVTNVIIQYTNIYVIADDDKGRREVKLIGNGDGMYITNGKAIPIKWSKTSHNSPTTWTDTSGKALTLNKGKTWVNVFANKGNVVIE